MRDLPFDAIQFCIYEQLRMGYKLAVSLYYLLTSFFTFMERYDPFYVVFVIMAQLRMVTILTSFPVQREHNICQGPIEEKKSDERVSLI